MPSTTGRKLRCAIYTRKSTEEGLDQAFNSLDAQREACAAYILSQQHEGWTLLPDFYNDGGCSGGTIERPALQQLLADVRAGRVDVVVVYKIDRLTRSLADFAKIVEVLDAAETSFISVTQAFNTTNSMGRLTLNVLLSFAQFEREVIAERVRDKVAASKAKGMWMGGSVPLGYRAEDRKLVVVPEEASTVREIMERYLRSPSVPDLVVELSRAGITSKKRIGRDGTPRGGVPFKRGALAYLLSNRLYVGETVHHGKAYPGQHEAIVSCELFEAVQAKLASRTNPKSAYSRKVVSLLAGMTRDQHGRPMTPTHTQNHGRRYRYYASHLGDGKDVPALRLPAGELDAAVKRELARFFRDSERTRELASGAATDDLSRLISRCQQLSGDVEAAPTPELRTILRSLGVSVEVATDGIELCFSCEALLQETGIRQVDGKLIKLQVATHQASFGHEPRLRLDPHSGVFDQTNRQLIEVIGRAFAAREQLIAMSDEELASAPVTQLRHLQRIARLSYLDPAIVRSVLNGTQPGRLSARTLWRQNKLPAIWAEQRALLLAEGG